MKSQRLPDPVLPNLVKSSFLSRGLCLIALLMLAGCGQQTVEWNGKDISDLMPELEYRLTDETGRETTAADYDGQVRVLFFGFTSCPDICPATLAHVRNALKEVPEGLRDEVKVLFVSVDPKRDSPQDLAEYTGFFGPRFIGMTGSEEQLRDLSQRYRTTFGYGEPDDSGHYDVSHSSAIYVFDRQGDTRLLMRSDLSPAKIAEDLTRILEEPA
jgi:protein SCO1/2